VGIFFAWDGGGVASSIAWKNQYPILQSRITGGRLKISEKLFRKHHGCGLFFRYRFVIKIFIKWEENVRVSCYYLCSEKSQMTKRKKEKWNKQN